MKQLTHSLLHLPVSLTGSTGRNTGKIKLGILLLPLFLLFFTIDTQAFSYKVVSWRGTVKIKGRKIKLDKVFELASDVKFSKTSDYVIAKDASGQAWTVTPTSFQKDPAQAEICSSKNCIPKFTMGDNAIKKEKRLELVDRRGTVLISGKLATISQKFSSDDAISFDRNSDFLVVKDEAGQIFLIRPQEFVTDDKIGHTCQGAKCQAVTETAAQVKKTRPAFYNLHIRPYVNAH